MKRHRVLPCLMRLSKVPGFEERVNDIVYGSPIKIIEKPNVTVFFGGDVQEFTENMVSHRNKKFVKWNLENTARLLQNTFKDSHIVVINSVRKFSKTFSCYDNFVPSSDYGIPNHLPMHRALLHLEKLLYNIDERMRTMSELEITTAMEFSKKSLISENSDEMSLTGQVSEYSTNISEDQNSLANGDLKLIGFSKGCVVLNQFLHEFHHYKTSNDTDSLGIIMRIKDMYWLDGGHSGQFDTWMTSRSLLETLTGLGINIHVHVTPYQIEDKKRPWIKKEEKIFSNTLHELGAPIQRKIHSCGVEPNLEEHFNILKEFGRG
ncbi:hypothetical protein JTB14_019142 [Gonioctena quinquepunctata]|nr:hypothetical protein JTB14_019142 [Gonioctena quinquepunctata]